MKRYLQIVVSILIALMLICIIILVGLTIYGCISTDCTEFSQINIVFPLLVFGGGAVMVAPVASILWLMIYKTLKRFSLDEHRNNKISVIISLFLCPLVLKLFDDGDLSGVIVYYFITLPPIIPVAFASYLVYKYLFIDRIGKNHT